MSDVSTLVSGRAEAAGVVLVVEGQGGALQADRRLLKEALVNVVCNAIEATPRGGARSASTITTATAARASWFATPPRHEQGDAARVGTPFFTTRENGTGLAS